MKNHPNSLNAYFDPNNKVKFNTHRGMIIRKLFAFPNQHSYLLAEKLNLKNEAIKKRLTDMHKEGIIEVSGNFVYHGNTVSLYKIKDQLQLFEVEKIPSFINWAKKQYPGVLNEYKSLYKN